MVEQAPAIKTRRSIIRLLRSRVIGGIALVVFAVPYLLLLWLSLGSGWSYPNLGPDRIDFRPWKAFVSHGSGLLQGALTAGMLSLCVATLSTTIGILAGRHVRALRGIGMLIAYLPFACSPVIVGICLLDLFIRIGLASTLIGVFLIQSVFASAFAVILFGELWSPEIERLEYLVQTLGGSRWMSWRHAVWPRLWKLTAVCWLQTLLFSWLDYSFVSTIGGGVVPALTLGVVAYLREASVNQAAQAAIVLIIPPILFMLLIGALMRQRLPMGSVDG